MSVFDGVRTALRMIFGSTGSAVDSLSATDAAIRVGLPLSRRIGFVSLAGGAGTTTTVASVAAALAGRRTGSLLAVDADGGRSGLARHLNAVRPPGSDEPDPDQADRRRLASTVEDARAGLPLAGRLPVLDLNAVLDVNAAEPNDQASGARRPRSVAEWTDHLGPIARFFDLVLTDWGVRPAGEDLEQVAYSGHVLVLVSRADQPAALAAADALAGLQALPEAPRLMLALADVNKTATPRRLAGTLAESLGVPVFRLPYDPVVGSDWFAAVGRRSVASRAAAARLAAGIVTEAAGNRASGRLPNTSSVTSSAKSSEAPSVVRTA